MVSNELAFLAFNSFMTEIPIPCSPLICRANQTIVCIKKKIVYFLDKVFATVLLIFSLFIIVVASSRVCLASILKLYCVSKS